jgi:hypothetical protein
VPTIAYFLGIAVRMFFNDHDPPHFHVRYQGFRARIRIADGEIIDGKLPPTVVRVQKNGPICGATRSCVTGAPRVPTDCSNASRVWNDDRRHRR